MRRWIAGIMAGLFAALALVAKHFKSRADRLQAEAAERDAREKAHVVRMQERVAAVRKEHNQMAAADPKNRTDFE